jgi:hypothetical protein
MSRNHNKLAVITATAAAALFSGGLAVRAEVDGGSAKPDTVDVEYIAQQGDTLGSVERGIIAAAGGVIEIPPERLTPFLKTEVNPDSKTFQDPNDQTLQIGEEVVGTVPLKEGDVSKTPKVDHFKPVNPVTEFENSMQDQSGQVEFIPTDRN